MLKALSSQNRFTKPTEVITQEVVSSQVKAIPAKIIEEPATDFIDICSLSEKESIEYNSDYTLPYEERAFYTFGPIKCNKE